MDGENARNRSENKGEHMPQYKKTSTKYLDAFLRDCFLRFIDNHDDVINDDDCFEPLERFLDAADYAELVDEAKRILPPELSGVEVEVAEAVEDGGSARRMEKRALRTVRGRRFWNCDDAVDWDRGPQTAMAHLWAARNGRRYVRLLCRDAFGRIGKKFGTSARDPFRARLEKLREALKLDDLERDLVALGYLLSQGHWGFRPGRRGLGCSFSRADKISFYAKCLDAPRASVVKALSSSGNLQKFALFDSDLDYNDEMGGFLDGLANKPFHSHFYTRAVDRPLPMEYYGDIAKTHGEVLKELLDAGGPGRAPAVLFYGVPGSGKTSFAKTLAAAMGRECWFVNQGSTLADREGGRARSDSSPAYRFAALRLAQRSLDPKKSLVVVDESDAMIGGGEIPGFLALFGAQPKEGADKGKLNAVLDELTVPTIWISNTSNRSLDVSNRRRFDYSVRFDELNDAQRAAIWRNAIAKRKLGKLFDDARIERFASTWRTSAGGIAMVLDNVARLKCTRANVEERIARLMKQHCELLGLDERGSDLAPAKDYSLEGLNLKSSVPLERIVKAIGRYCDELEAGKPTDDAPRMNLLLSGPPGTGKTEFVKYLGSRLNRRVEVRMGSDLLGPYVGQTEHQIAAAFRRAEATRSILFLDEIDGLLQSREGASRSWEVTQVNELLHQMENFKGVFVGATNFSKNLDAATARRFTFKVEFDFLTDEGKRLFFERMFRATLSDEEKKVLDGIRNLAPGDFRTARQSLYYLGDDATNADRLDALRQESRAKDGTSFAKGGKLGF